MHPVFHEWRAALCRLNDYYTRKRPQVSYFYLRLFFFFVILNVGCYWWGIFTAFPGAVFGEETRFYFKVQVPVGILGALFDSLSFFVTVYIIRRALKATSGFNFVSHLSFDLIIAVLATFWVLFVFSFSGWLVSLTEPVKETLSDRNDAYRSRALIALQHPVDNVRNIYFGIIMGVSAMLPTCIHLYMAGRSAILAFFGTKRLST